jgi:hypothetical protein
MSNYRDLEDIKNELTKRLNESRNKLALWQSVKRVTKKDGGNFAILNKNFEGARVEQEYSSVYLKAATYYLPEAERKAISHFRWTSEEIYIAYRDDELTPEIVSEKIAGRIEQLKKHITEYENELAAVEDIFKKYDEKLAVFYQELKADCEQFRDDTGSTSALEYMIEDYAKSYYVRRR